MICEHLDIPKRPCRDCYNAYQRRYQRIWKKQRVTTDIDREKARVIQARYRARLTPEAKARRAAHKATPRAKAMHLNREHKRRAIKLKAAGSFTKTDIEQLLIRQNGLCAYCETALKKYEIDHVIPLSRNGSNGIENIALACLFCNRSKGNKTLEEWRSEQG